jgi:hypothetical protein
MEGNDGSYGSSGSPLTHEIDISDGVTLTGDTTQAMPVIYSNNTSGLADGGVYVEGASSVLQYVDVEWSGSYAAVAGTGTWNRVIAHANSGAACTFYSGTTTVTDSVCDGSADGVYDNWSVGGPPTSNFTANLYNDTIVSPNYGMFLYAETQYVDITMNLENTIVRSTASSSPTDIYLTETSCGIDEVTASYSNYANVTIGPNACAEIVYTQPTLGNNQTTSPQFANAGGNNFAEASGSPTIGAGTNDPTNAGPLDLSGALRDIAGRTDIGAYEYVYAPALTTLAASSLSTAAATLGGSVNPNGAAASYHFDYGTTAAYGASTPSQSLAAGASAQSVSAALSALQPGTTYHYRLVATNSGGTTSGPDSTFTTPALPQMTFTQTRTRWRAGHAAASFAKAHHKTATAVGTTFTVTLNEPAAYTLSFQKTLSGRRGKSGVCVAQTKKNKRRARCTYTEDVGMLTASGHSATNTVTFDGVLTTGTKLGPGSYTVTATASAYAVSTQPVSLNFQIVRH